MRIIQLLPTLSYGDAIGNDVLAMKKIIQEMGFDTSVYAENIDNRLPSGVVRTFSEFPNLADNDVIIYHASTGTDLNYKLPQLGGRKLMIYHNITPPDFFQPYSSAAEQLAAYGLQGIKYLADQVEQCLAVSEFNSSDLRKMGFTCPIDVCPILIPFRDYERTPNQHIIRKYREDGYVNLLFTGRIAPNKKQEDVIRAFYYYHTYHNPKSRLILVGSWNGLEKYYNRLCDYIKVLGITDSVIFPGHIKFDELLAYYKIADVFVCMSEHEGFCVPLVEAMYFNIPIIAYCSTAIPETLGGSGLLLENKDPKAAATAIHRVVSDEKLRKRMVEGQRRRLEDFQYYVVRRKIEDCLQGFMSNPIPRKPKIVQLTSTISRGDAVSNDILAFHHALLNMGYSPEIYSEIQPKGAGWEVIRSVDKMPLLSASDIAIYHHATGTSLSRYFASLPCKKVLVYHNVTPPVFFEPYDQNAAECCQWGLDNLKEMLPYVDQCIAVSQFNKSDLRRLGYQCKISVCPILIPFDDYQQKPDETVLTSYRDGNTNLIFVGRIAPNKKFEDIIAVFSEYQKQDKQARLFLVGSYDEKGKYYQYLKKFIEKIHASNVIFTGHISFSEILAYYSVADIFLCMSEHEGFCVPLIEAMYFDVPIVAYASTAIPETLGESGMLLQSKDPQTVVQSIRHILTDSMFRNEILKKQRERLAAFSYENVYEMLFQQISDLIGEKNER